jgi:hypothetical protein
MKIKLFNESFDEGSDVEKVEDLLMELIDLGWESTIKEVLLSDDFYQFKEDSKIKGFKIELKPPFGFNLTQGYTWKGHDSDKLDDYVEHFEKWSEWLSTIPSVLKKLSNYIGDIKVFTNFGESVPWGSSRWLVIMVKRQKM